MPYATKVDLELRFGAPEIAQLERTLSALGQSIDTALQDASDMADGYICAHYDVPLDGVPQNLKIYVCDIARYLLWKSKPSEIVEARYKEAISYLTKVSTGKAKLLIKDTVTQEVKEPDTRPSTMPIGTTYTGGVFGDATLDMMPSIK